MCKALAPKFKEPNAIVSVNRRAWARLRPAKAYISFLPRKQVVFKALLTLHTIIRNGATDNILAYLSNGDVLRLKNVAALHWEGALFTKRPDPGIGMTTLTIYAQDIMRQRIYLTTPRISTHGFELFAILNTMPSASSRRTTAI